MRGRKPVDLKVLKNKFFAGEVLSNYHLEKLADLGIIAKAVVREENAGRGRPRVEWNLTGKGRGQKALYGNRFRKAA